MGRQKRQWQDVNYVLCYSGKPGVHAQKDYPSYVEAGLEHGHRAVLTGCGLIRSLGGWSEVKKLRLKGQDHIMSDERILGESGFVNTVLS